MEFSAWWWEAERVPHLWSAGFEIVGQVTEVTVPEKS